ncbi:hypothetical protein AAFC00_003624 [Neodothiora populina]|uniref:Ubiquitin-like domain-containing protein n=1 Tax=Neodothiora populina TaxID=2781224 RepID=A0ABR3PEU1_9PEZI
MSTRRSASHSTGSARAAFIEDEDDDLSYDDTQSPTSTSSSGSLSVEDWQVVDDIRPSDSVTARYQRSSNGSISSRPLGRPLQKRETRPTSSRRKSSHRLSTIRDDDHQHHSSRSASGSEHSGRRSRRHTDTRDERSYRFARDPRERLPSSGSGSSSVESYDSYQGGGGPYDYQLHPAAPHPASPFHPHHVPPPSNYPPTVLSGYDPHVRPMHPPYDAALVPMMRHESMSQYGGGAYPPQSSNPFAPGPSMNNPFSPVTATASAAGEYFPPYDRPSPPSAHSQHAPPMQFPPPHLARPRPQSRPQSYAGPAYPGMEQAVAPYYQPPAQYHGYPQGADPQLIAQYLHELQLREKSQASTPEPRSAKSKSPANPTPAPPPAPEPPKEDQAERLIALMAEYENKKQAAIDAKLKEEAEAAAAEQKKKDAIEAESAKIAALLQKFQDDAAKARKEELDKIEAERKVAEEKAARDAELAAAASAAREAAEKEAAAKAKAAEEEATAKAKAAEEKAKAAEEEAIAKAKAAEEEHAKKLAELKAAEEAATAKAKAAEESLAKIAPAPDDAQPNVTFFDALGRKFEVPWRFAKTWKGMKTLIEQMFAHVDGIGQNVMDGRYDILGPEGNILLPAVWELVIEAGWTIRMELWPEPEPDPVLPGAFPPEMMIDVGKKPKSSKKDPSRTKSVSRQHGAVPPPPPIVIGGDGDPIVQVEKEKKPKKKPPQQSGGFLKAWIAQSAGAPRARASSGKDGEKPGINNGMAMVPSHHRQISGTNGGVSAGTRRMSHSGGAKPANISMIVRRKSEHTDEDHFVVVERHNVKSVAQGKSAENPPVACAVM